MKSPGKSARIARATRPMSRNSLARRVARLLRAICVGTLLLAGATAIAQRGPFTKTMPIYVRPKPASRQPTAEVENWIAALSDESLWTRDAAAQSLLEMGPKIESQLQWALDGEPLVDLTTSMSGRPLSIMRMGSGYARPRYAYHSVSVLIDRFEDQRWAAPSIVTLHYKDALLTDILSDFGNQIGADVSISATSNGLPDTLLDWIPAARRTIDIDRVSYWQALRVLLRGLPLRVAGHGELLLRVTNDYVPPGNGPLAIDGTGAVVSGSMLIAPSLTASAGSTLFLRALAEARVSGVTDRAIVRIDECTDDLGHSLLNGNEREFVSPPNKDGHGFVYDPWSWKVPIPLAALAPGRRVGTIRGQFGVGVAPPSQSVALPGLMQPGVHSVSFDGIVVTVKSVTPSGLFFELRGEVSAPADSPIGSAETDNSLDRWMGNHLALSVMDETNVKIRRQMNYGVARQEGGRVVVDWTITTILDKGQPATLLWETPDETRWLMAPFELHSIAVSSVTTK